MATTDEIAGEVRIRLVIALLDEVARVRPYVPRTQLVRSITGRRDFETLLKAGRVTPRRMVDVEGALAHWLGREG